MIRKQIYIVLKDFYKRYNLNQNKISYVLENVNSENSGFFTKVLNHTIKNHIKIDYILKKLIKNFKSIPPASKTFLRLGVSQLLLGIDEYASVNETVNLVNNKKQKNFINAVLRNFIRNKKSILKDLPENIEYGYPKWIYDKINFLEHRKDILKKHIENPEVTLRVNDLKITTKDLIEELKDLGISTKHSNHFKNSLIVENNKDILLFNHLYDQGYYYIQNESSQLASLLLNPKENEFVLDTCSAPGGKTTHLAQLMNDNGIIDAFENDIIRLEKVKNNLKRMDINIINAELTDSSKVKLNKKYNKVLIDAPCTSTGISSMHPEVLLRLKEESIDIYSKIQKNILNNILPQLEKGTEVLYSTCTLFKEENSKNMEYIKNKFHIDFINIDNELKYYNIKSQFDNQGYYIKPDSTMIPFYISKFIIK